MFVVRVALRCAPKSTLSALTLRLAQSLNFQRHKKSWIAGAEHELEEDEDEEM